MKVSRRFVLRGTASAFVAPVLASSILPSAPATAEAPIWKHALSLFGDTKYPEGFKHFD